MSLPLPEVLGHIRDECAYLVQRSEGLDKSTFIRDEDLRRAFVRSLEIIGEAAKSVPDDVRAAASDIEWRKMAGMRDRLIHGYFGVDLDLVWETVTVHVPRLREQIDALLGDGH